jgi:hypothetical protein
MKAFGGSSLCSSSLSPAKLAESFFAEAVAPTRQTVEILRFAAAQDRPTCTATVPCTTVCEPRRGVRIGFVLQLSTFPNWKVAGSGSLNLCRPGWLAQDSESRIPEYQDQPTNGHPILIPGRSLTTLRMQRPTRMVVTASKQEQRDAKLTSVGPRTKDQACKVSRTGRARAQYLITN